MIIFKKKINIYLKFYQFSNFKLYPPQIHENNGATKTMLPQEAKFVILHMLPT
jgi:hypothetical protein